MYYLSLALYAEGPTDYRFLSPLLYRLCDDICLQELDDCVEISDVLALNHSQGSEGRPRDVRILDAAKNARGAWKILFVHADGGRDPNAARKFQVDPALERVRTDMAGEGVGVGVIPVYEMESWILADANALREVLGTTLSDRELRLPAVARVERESDPKALLRRCYDLARPGARNRGRSEVQYFPQLGECVSLDILRKIPSFRQLEAELREALRILNILKT